MCVANMKLYMRSSACEAVCMRPSVCELYVGWGNLCVTQTDVRLYVRQRLCVNVAVCAYM